MNLKEKAGTCLFWLLDFSKGSIVRKQYKDIVNIIRNIDDPKVIERQKEYLDAILNHAITSTPFYKDCTDSKIENFPVVSKDIIRSSFDSFQSSKYINKKRVAVSTSGSTGASFTVYQNKTKRARNTADVLYFSELAGFRLGYKLIYLRFWSMFNKRNKLQGILQNIVSIDVFDLTIEVIQRLLIRMRKDPSNKGMLGYASSFDKICDYLESNKSDVIPCNVKSAIAMSEPLNPVTKERMKKYFGVNVVSRYSNSENGMIAQQPLGKEYFEINSASYFIEILEVTNNNPVAPGQLGRIVITDLFNYSMPLIRYDTGDMGCMTIETIQGKQKKVLSKVEGRKVDMIRNTSGELLSASIILVINKYKEIKQRQIIQKDQNEYVIKIKVDGNDFARKDEFVTEFREYLGNEANIKLEYVEDIPLLTSGKQRAVVCEYIP
ncbi:phenylacetate--CoA ligase family protein [Aquimarina pacifica]|uniref:phenylacetate--CoA ligase family protein n=1 Tax=Aquimarina pacifica TaxID=1296415 RepID=UPI00054D99B1|nr:phenylacetate--CoA ligase family protein [Aquimarina pacifica]